MQVLNAINVFQVMDSYFWSKDEWHKSYNSDTSKWVMIIAAQSEE